MTMTTKEQDFFTSLQTWKPAEPKTLLQRLLRRNTTQDQQTKTCVFVAEGQPAKVMQIPYDPLTQLLKNPDTGEVYLKPLQGDIYFFDRASGMPLQECPTVDQMYDIPEHLALSFYNIGYAEAELSGFKDLIAQINKFQVVMMASIIGAVIITLVNLYCMREVSGSLTLFAEQAEGLLNLYNGVPGSVLP